MCNFQGERLTRKVNGCYQKTYKMLLSAAKERAERKLKEKELELKEAKKKMEMEILKENQANSAVKKMLLKELMELDSRVIDLLEQLHEAIIQAVKIVFIDNQGQPTQGAMLIRELQMMDLAHTLEDLRAKLQQATTRARNPEEAGCSHRPQQQQQER